MTKLRSNVGASVRARLLKIARERGEDYQVLLTRYVNERLLYRLGQSEHSNVFVLKGAALFTLWTGKPHRTTRDVDLLGFGPPTIDRLLKIFVDLLELEVDDDGVVFDSDSLDVSPIREEQEYGGLRVTLVARVTSAKVSLQIDAGSATQLLRAPSPSTFRRCSIFPRLNCGPIHAKPSLPKS